MGQYALLQRRKLSLGVSLWSGFSSFIWVTLIPTHWRAYTFLHNRMLLCLSVTDLEHWRRGKSICLDGEMPKEFVEHFFPVCLWARFQGRLVCESANLGGSTLHVGSAIQWCRLVQSKKVRDGRMPGSSLKNGRASPASVLGHQSPVSSAWIWASGPPWIRKPLALKVQRLPASENELYYWLL